MSSMAVSVAMLRYSKMKNDQTIHKYTTFANEIIREYAYGTVHMTALINYG